MLDPRGPRTAAWITSVVLVVTLLVPSTVALVLVVLQAVVFALGSRGRSPYGWVFRTFVRPRLAPPSELEDPQPVRFAQTVGLGFAVVAVVGFATGVTLLGQVATGFALVAALLNASIGLCLGCEAYLTLHRLTARLTDTNRRTA